MNNFQRVLGRIVTMRDGEATGAVLMFAYSFLAMTSYNILKPLTRSKFIADLGSENLPYVLLGSGFVIGVLMHWYTHVAGRIARRHVIPVTQAAIIVLLVVFSVVLRTGAPWATVSFYVFGQILGLFLISQFWTLANDVYDARQAKRLFGFIGAGAALGGALGSAIVRFVVNEVGTDNLLLVSAVTLGACLGIVLKITKRHAITSGATVGDEKGVSGGEAIRLLRESRHLRIVALAVACAASGATIVEQQVNMAADAAAGDAAGIAAFLAEIGIYVSLAAFVVQVGATSRIHRSLGLAFALLLLPVALGSMATLVLMTGAFWAAAAARVLDSTLRYSIDKTSREVLFLPLPSDMKYRAKPFIDVTMDRFSKGATAVVLLVLIQPWGAGLDWRRLSYASIVVTGLWIATALLARKQYLNSFRENIGTRTVGADAVRVDVGDPATIEALVEELSNPDPNAVLYAIRMLETFDKRNLISPLLLQHESPQVRVRALRALSAVRSRIAIRWKSVVERMTHDPDVDVRAAALRALAEFSHEDALALMRRHLNDAEPRVAVTAAVGLANSSNPADVDAAEKALKRLVQDSRDAGAAGRREAAVALAHITLPQFRPLLVPLLYDRDVRVVEAAIGAARALGAADGLFLPGLISLLGHRTLKAAARETLIGYGEPAIDALAYALADTREHFWVRRHIPTTIAAIPCQAAMDALVAALGDADGFLRYKAILAIQQLHREHPELGFAAAAVERLLLHEASRYYNVLALQHDFTRGAEEQRSLLLGRAMAEKLGRTLDRIYRLLGLLYDAEDVAAARHTIEHGEPRRRAAAVEYLDNLLKGTVRRRVLPLLEDTSLAEKLRHAYIVLKTRPRNLEETLVRLVHDSDPVVAAAAVHFIARHQLWSMTDDLHFVLRHRPDDRMLVEAVTWALQLHAGAHTSDVHPRPIVELAHRMRRLPLFEFVSIDELFRIAGLGQEAHLPAGRELATPGAAPDHVRFLIEGTVAVRGPGGDVQEIAAPSVLGLEEVLQGAPTTRTVRAVEPVVCVQVQADDFLTMISSNAQLAESLFGLLLADDARDGFRRFAPAGGVTWDALAQPVDRALALRDHPLLARATPTQLLALVTAARDIPLEPGAVMFEPEDAAAVYEVIEGEIALEYPLGVPEAAGCGAAIGVAETLAGAAAGCRASVVRPGRALRISREDLFAVLTDHVDLMQGIFGELLTRPRKDVLVLAAAGVELPHSRN